MIYAIDFDGTIVENKWPEIGALKQDAKKFITGIKAAGHTFILYTNRSGDLLKAAVNFLKENDLTPDFVNENEPSVIKHFGGDTRKVYADVYIDDHNAGGLVWPSIRWIGLTDFDQQSDFSDEIGQKLTQEIQSRLGNKPFLPVGTLPDAFFSELPPLHIQGHAFYWNAYMLASTATHKLTSLQIVNTEPSPYTVTAMVLPQPNDFDGVDVVDFIFRVLQQTSTPFASADQVFDFLKENKIRMFKSKKLLERINAFWEF